MRQRGFSMIEMVVALLVLSTLGAAAGYGLVGGVRAFSENAEVLRVLDKLRYASERMAREVREVRRDTADPSRFDITEMSATTMSFTRGDGTAVTLDASPPLLTLAYADPVGTWTLADGVGSARFVYFRSDGSTSATGNADVAYVEFELQLSRAGRLFPQRTRVALRNRR